MKVGMAALRLRGVVELKHPLDGKLESNEMHEMLFWARLRTAGEWAMSGLSGATVVVGGGPGTILEGQVHEKRKGQQRDEQ